MQIEANIHLAATHDNSLGTLSTPGLGLIARQDQYLAGLGFYKNSIGNRTNYAFIGAQPVTIGKVRLGAIAGIADGYKSHITPLAAGIATISLGASNLNILVIPKVKGLTPTTVGLTISWKIK